VQAGFAIVTSRIGACRSTLAYRGRRSLHIERQQ